MELARAQLEALRLEIHPHFLFNTLNSIAALIRVKDNSRALEMLLGLSELMRATVDGPRDHLVPLSTEIDFVRRYVDLQRARFADRLDIRWDVDAAALTVPVPTLLLQPLVENAVRHGTAPQSRRCAVTIAAPCRRRPAPPARLGRWRGAAARLRSGPRCRHRPEQHHLAVEAALWFARHPSASPRPKAVARSPK